MLEPRARPTCIQRLAHVHRDTQRVAAVFLNEHSPGTGAVACGTATGCFRGNRRRGVEHDDHGIPRCFRRRCYSPCLQNDFERRGNLLVRYEREFGSHGNHVPFLWQTHRAGGKCLQSMWHGCRLATDARSACGAWPLHRLTRLQARRNKRPRLKQPSHMSGLMPELKQPILLIQSFSKIRTPPTRHPVR